MASGVPLLRMNCELADSAGHVCQRRSWLDTVLPSPMSLPAMRTSTVSICATGAGAGGGASDRPASKAAMPPAAIAMIRTMMRAGFMTLTFHKSRCDQDGAQLSPSDDRDGGRARAI